MKERILLFVYNSPKLINIFRLLNFFLLKFKKIFLIVGYSIEKSKENLTFFAKLFYINKEIFLFSIIFACFLQYTDQYLYNYYLTWGWLIPDDDDYVSFLAAISGIGGVFIGLYFTAISTISSSIYAQVPSNIRDLFSHEKLGSVYIKILAFTTVLGILLITFKLLGYNKIVLAIPVMAILSAFAIFSFTVLGRRIFSFFDPTALSDNIFFELHECTKEVQVGRHGWLDPISQDRAHKQAYILLETLITISNISIEQKHLRGEPFVNISKKVLDFLILYEHTKKLIPTESKWYEKKYEYEDWYKSGDTDVLISHQTGTFVDPNILNDKYWLEDKLFPIIGECLKANLEDKKYNNAFDLLNYINNYLEKLSSEHKLNKAYKILDDLILFILPTIAPESEEKETQDEILEKLSIIENISSIKSCLILAYSRITKNVNKERYKNTISKIRWQSNSNIYKHDLPEHLLSRLEWFLKGIQFEYKIHGVAITPIWYQVELIFQVEADNIFSNLMSIYKNASTSNEELIQLVRKSNNPWFTGTLLSREWEYWHKVDASLEVFEKAWDSISANRLVDGLSWPSFDAHKFVEISSNRQEELLEHMPIELFPDILTTKPVNFPDYAGQFLHAIGESVLLALIENNKNLFKKTFPIYFLGCLQKFERLKPAEDCQEVRKTQSLKLACSPLMELLDISGYSYLMSDFHNTNEFKTVVTDVWNKYFEGENKQKALLFSTAILLTEASFEIAHRSVFREIWNQKITDKLSELHKNHTSYRTSYGSVVSHDSALVRIFSSDRSGNFYDGIDIFIALYLQVLELDKSLEFSYRRRNFSDEIKRNKDEYKDRKDD